MVCEYVTALNGYKPVACFISETLICEPHPVWWFFYLLSQENPAGNNVFNFEKQNGRLIF